MSSVTTAQPAGDAISVETATITRGSLIVTIDDEDETGRSCSRPGRRVVLKRVRESEAVFLAGELLIETGDPSRLEVVADLLSSDAVRVRTGARAIIDGSGGLGTLAAPVLVVEPSGFTKVSALGVEEQRVNLRLDITGAGGAGSTLGDATRVAVSMVLWEGADVLRVPSRPSWAGPAVQARRGLGGLCRGRRSRRRHADRDRAPRLRRGRGHVGPAARRHGGGLPAGHAEGRIAGQARSRP